MNKIFSNATVWWDENDLTERDALVSQCVNIVTNSWKQLNSSVRGCRIETPVLTPSEFLGGHISEGFPMLETSHGILRPETTAGCIEAFHQMFPNKNQIPKQLPFYVWQFGLSFRNEDNPDTMRASKLRLREFHQLEFELFCAENTKANYIDCALDALVGRFGGKKCDADDLPHYSRRTVDWFFGELEVAGCSERTDWEHGVIYEVSIGIDRLLKQII